MGNPKLIKYCGFENLQVVVQMEKGNKKAFQYDAYRPLVYRRGEVSPGGVSRGCDWAGGEVGVTRGVHSQTQSQTPPSFEQNDWQL